MIITLKSTISREAMNGQNYNNIDRLCLQQTANEIDLSEFFAPAINLLSTQITDKNN